MDKRTELAKRNNAPVITGAKNGQATITSVELVQLINQFRVEEGNTTQKEHKHLMRDIRNEIEALKQAGVDQSNFGLVNYIDKKGEERPCYSMNKAGALQMLNKESAIVRFKTIQYIETLEGQVKHRPLTPQEELRLHYQVLEQQQEEIQEVKSEVADLKHNMPLFNIDCKELQELVRRKGTEVLGGYRTPAYNDKSIRGKVYSDIQNQLKREFGVSKYERIKHSQLGVAKEIVNTYKAPVVLVEQIQNLNNQITI